MSELSKDVMIKFTNAQRSTNEQGKLRVQLSMNDQVAVELIEELTKLVGSQRGKEGKNSIKLDVHIREREHEGRTFDSGFGFVKAVQDFGAGGPKKTFKAPTAASFDVNDKIAKLKAKTLGA